MTATRLGTKWLDACERTLADPQLYDTADLIERMVKLGRQVCAANHTFLKEADEYEPKLAKIVERRRGIRL